MKKTSVEAFYKIKESGLLSKRRWETYECVYKLQPCTIKNVVQSLDPTKWSTYSARFSELEKMGLIEVSGQIHDFETKQSVNTYVVTGNLPTKLPMPKKLNIKKASKLILEYMEQNNLAFIYRSQLEVLGEKQC